MSSSHDPDRALLEAWRSGDARAGDRLVRRHYARVFRFFDLKAGFVAEDLTQRTFLACLDGDFRGEGSFRAYLFGIARRQYLDHQRRAGRGEVALERIAAEQSGVTSLSLRLARSQQQQQLLLALARLPEPLLAAVQLYYWEGMPTAEIGTVMQVPASTITSRLQRARELLREHLRAGAGASADAVRDLDVRVRALATIFGSVQPPDREPITPPRP